MAAHQVQTFFEPRVAPGLACMCPLVELAEEKRIGQRPAADRDRRAAGLLEHGRRIVNRPDVAVGHDGNSFHGLDHGPDAVPVHMPENPCGGVLPCTITAAAPTCSNSRAKTGAVSDSSSHPSRILTVTGIEMARTTAATSSTARSTWQSKAEPPPPRTTFLTRAAHVDIHDGCPVRLDPASGLLNLGDDVPVKLDRQRAVLDAGFGQLHALRRCSISDRALTRSVVASPRPPQLRTASRKARLV